MDLENLKIRSLHVLGLLGLMPWVIANMYLTLVVNWPDAKSAVEGMNIEDLHVVGAMNFYFCIYTLVVILALILQRYCGAMTLICHGLIIFGFCVGIGIVYAVIYAVRGVVSSYINAAVLLDTFFALYGLIMLYLDMFLKWHKNSADKNKQSPINTTAY